MACPVSVQGRLRGRRCRGRSFGGRPHADSRVPLTGGRTRHNSVRGDVPSPRASTASGMVMQCPEWCRDGGDGRTGPTATEVTGSAGLTSRRSPGQAWNRRPSPFEGSTVLFRGCDASAVREWAAQCNGTAAGHAAQCRTVAGMASPGGVGGTASGRDSLACQGRGVDSSLTWAPANVRALNASVGGAGMGAASP
jgi:hypothetical protein